MDDLPPEFGVDETGDFEDGSAREEMWSCILHKTTDLSFPKKYMKFQNSRY